MNEKTILPIDPFFEVLPDVEWNACVGIQGASENYVDGYLEAALTLVACVIDKRLVASRDTLVMPILYNCRHALELSLKFAIDRLYELDAIAERHPVNHDIQSHWRHLSAAGLGDSRLVELIAQLEPFVASLASIDDDGQEFRYAVNRDGAKSLASIALVNLRLVRHSIGEMSTILQHLKCRLYEMQEERATGTYTKECSRADLEEMVITLGNHASWKDPDFERRKAAVRERFGLGARKLSEAIKAIRASRPLAAKIGLETDLKYLSDAKAVAVLQRWLEAHPIKPNNSDDLGTDFFERDWEKLQEHAAIRRELDQAVIDLLDVEELADLQVLFYIGRNGDLGEHYEEDLTRTIADYRAKSSLNASVRNLMSKTNLLDGVVAGSIAAGRPSLAATLRKLRS